MPSPRLRSESTVQAPAPTLGSKLHALRTARSKSLRAVAEDVGCTAKHLWSIENGGVQRPSNELLVRIADYYQVSLDELFGRSSPGCTQVPPQLADYWQELDDAARSNLLSLIKSLAGRR